MFTRLDRSEWQAMVNTTMDLVFDKRQGISWPTD